MYNFQLFVATFDFIRQSSALKLWRQSLGGFTFEISLFFLPLLLFLLPRYVFFSSLRLLAYSVVSCFFLLQIMWKVQFYHDTDEMNDTTKVHCKQMWRQVTKKNKAERTVEPLWTAQKKTQRRQSRRNKVKRRKNGPTKCGAMVLFTIRLPNTVD